MLFPRKTPRMSEHHALANVVALAGLAKQQGKLIEVLGALQNLLLDLRELDDPRITALFKKYEVEFIEPA